MRFLELKAEVSTEKVLKKIKCYPDSDLYEEFLEEKTTFRLSKVKMEDEDA